MPEKLDIPTRPLKLASQGTPVPLPANPRSYEAAARARLEYRPRGGGRYLLLALLAIIPLPFCAR